MVGSTPESGRAGARLSSVDLEELDDLATALPGVRRTARDGVARWQLRGRLVARELDETHVVIRVPFDVRDALLHQYPHVFSVPARFVKHLMVVADLGAADAGTVEAALEDALESAWRLQSGGDLES